MPSTTDLIATVQDIAASTASPVAVAGGVAMHLVGSTRLTADVDLVALEEIDELPNEGPLTYGGYASTTSDGVQVDVMIRDDEFAELYEEALYHKETVDDVPAIVSEYLVAMKMVAGRPKDEQDIQFLLIEDVVDLDRARKIIRKHLGAYGVVEFDRLVEEAEWMRTRNR